MRTIIILTFILLISSISWAETAIVKVDGMVCSFCAQGIKKTFGKQESVGSVEVDLDNKTVTIKIKPEKLFSDDEIKKAITDAGYNVKNIERKND